MSAYDKLAVCLFNFKCKALEREGERKRKEHDGEWGVKEGERERERDAGIFLAQGEKDASDAGC